MDGSKIPFSSASIAFFMSCLALSMAQVLFLK